MHSWYTILIDKNLQGFKEHEIKAFFEYLEYSGTKVLPIGIWGPLPDRTDAVDLVGSQHMWRQSAAFVIAETNLVRASSHLQ